MQVTFTINLDEKVFNSIANEMNRGKINLGKKLSKVEVEVIGFSCNSPSEPIFGYSSEPVGRTILDKTGKLDLVQVNGKTSESKQVIF